MSRRKGEPCQGCGELVCQCLELALIFQMRAAELEEPVREFKAWPGRRFCADFAWPDKRLLVEVEGGTFNGGRHTRGSGFRRDCEKYNLATLAGWRVLRFDADMVRDGVALQMIERAIKGEKET